MDTQIQKYEDGYRVAADFTTLEFKILQKNNLQAAYLIHADNEVEKLEIGDIEDILPTKLGAQASGIEIWELERAHPNDEKYYGEKQMAKQYAEILEGCEKYMIQ